MPDSTNWLAFYLIKPPLHSKLARLYWNLLEYRSFIHGKFRIPVFFA